MEVYMYYMERKLRNMRVQFSPKLEWNKTLTN